MEWVESANNIPTELWQQYFPPGLEGQWWYTLLENSGLGKQFRFFYALVKSGQETVAIAPAFLMDVPIDIVAPDTVAELLKALGPLFPSLTYQRTLFIGSPCADEGTIGIKAGVKLRDLVVTLQNALEKKAQSLNAVMVVWKDMPSEYDEAMKFLDQEKNLFPMVSYPGTVLKFEGSASIDNYYAQLKGSRRHNLKKKIKRSKALVEIESTVMQKPDEKTLDEIFSLFWQTYEKGKTKFEKLNIGFFRLVAAYENSWFVLLREAASGKLLAFMLCFKLHDRVINKFIGFDYERPGEWNLYFRLWEVALAWVVSTGAKEFQSGQTGYRAKIDVGHELVPLTNHCKNLNPILQMVFAKVASSVDWSSLDPDLETFLKAHPEAAGEPEKALIT